MLHTQQTENKKNKMKTYSIFASVIIMILMCANACKKDGAAPVKKYPAPNWKANNDPSYAYSMTAVVQLLDTLQNDMSDNDEMAAFVGDDCRGIGVLEKRIGLPPVFYILIKGSASEQVKVKFKYYSAKNSYMYSTGDFLNFVADNNYGTVDEPAVPDLQPLN